jgi:hypothetical protein
MVNKISCPQCKQKFRTKTGRDWHLNHIHNLPKHSANLYSQTVTRSVANGIVTAKSADHERHYRLFRERFDELDKAGLKESGKASLLSSTAMPISEEKRKAFAYDRLKEGFAQTIAELSILQTDADKHFATLGDIDAHKMALEIFRPSINQLLNISHRVGIDWQKPETNLS